jgi:branched-chain amino acid transport system substrate-binding protein
MPVTCRARYGRRGRPLAALLLSLLLIACQAAPAAGPTTAPAKPTEPVKPAAPAAAGSPAASPAPVTSPAAVASPAAAAKPSGPPLQVGGVTALSGPQQTFGEGARMGAGLAAKEINARGGILGRPVELVFRDDEANPTKAVQAFEDLATNQKVRAILGPVNTPNALAVAAVADREKLINLQITTGTATVDPQKHPTIFRPQYYATQEAQVMLDYALGVLGWKCPAILADSTGYGQGGVAELKAQLAQRTVQACGEDQKYNPGDADMTGQLGRIQASKADGILAWGLGNDLAQAAKGLAKLGINLKMVGASGITTVGFRSLAGSDGKDHLGVYSRRFSFSDSQPADPKARDFIGKLDAEFGPNWTAQTVVSAPWYEALNLYAEAVNRAGSDDSAKVQAALEGLQNYPASGIYTTYSFGPNERNGFQAKDLAIVYAADEQHGLYRRPPNAS